MMNDNIYNEFLSHIKNGEELNEKGLIMVYEPFDINEVVDAIIDINNDNKNSHWTELSDEKGEILIADDGTSAIARLIDGENFEYFLIDTLEEE